MAEGNVRVAEADIYFTCIPCARLRRESEPKIEYLYVSSLEVHFPCAKCPEQFRHGLLARRIDPNGTPTHRCSACDDTFQRPSELFSHSMGHSGEWTHICDFCLQGFYINSLLEKHMQRRAVVRNLTCARCLRPFKGRICPSLYTDLTRLNNVFCGDCKGSRNIIEYVTD
ncbi:hypothetical protein TNIN_436021 [Trichonephila inaurata madagascariensis]|uniref:C2H2-type domain-containing protein n=1 Tax=Trichonephila inaurata madagascariensis TaxID=2747483 RepID=A0A8X6XAM1_9ARAC|nr:hypothetical protein TNIN_436021 [Trichonephila inaurata madagascariensis]